MPGTIWIIISYILGSIPFGYLISRLSGKNILEVGWRKTSGSNVFRNVGKRQGILTVMLDAGKGYLAAYGAKRLGLSLDVQAFSAAAAVFGHNWSIFLRFAGGRGISTFIGALLALSPKILFLSLIPFIALYLVWSAPIGTLFLLASVILLSIYYLRRFGPVGLFATISLAPILVKRLSPVKEIESSKDKAGLITSRLLLDNNKGQWDLRIMKLSGVKNNFSRAAERLYHSPNKTVVGIDEKDIKKMMMAASRKIILYQEDINKINVFPVADKDTGYNLAATLLGIEASISGGNYRNSRELAEDIKAAAMTNARGNVGMICTGYLIGVLDGMKDLRSIDAPHLALAMKNGIEAARKSIGEPTDGTILDVIQSAGEAAYEATRLKGEKDIIEVLEKAHKASESALRKTKDKLPVLKENNVVDAGALGFVKILEAWIESLRGIEIKSNIDVGSPVILSKAENNLATPAYEVTLSFKKEKDIQTAKIRTMLLPLGDSLDMVKTGNSVKVHIHTDHPDAVKSKFKNYPGAEFRVEDLIAKKKNAKKQPLGLVVDEVASLPGEIQEKYRIEEIPFSVRFPNGEILKSKEKLYPKMRQAMKSGEPLPTTSAPPARDLLLTYQKALDNFENVLVITLSAKLSGTYSMAKIAGSMFKNPTKSRVHVFDSNTAEVAEGLVAIRAAELISRGKTAEDIVKQLKAFVPQVTLVACLDDFKYVVQGGRFRLPEMVIKPIYAIQKIGVRLLVGLQDGKIGFQGVAFGKDIAKILSEEVAKQAEGKRIRVAIAHADNQAVAEDLRARLEKRLGTEVLFVTAVSPIAGTHVGPGTIIAAFHPISDERNPRDAS